jgi:tetratricopeptide (TPR) repeat protein
MALPVLFFVAAMAVRTDQTPLRSGCDAADAVVASLPVGTPVEVRFRLSDGSDCFKVAATIDGKDVLGYVPASALTGLERYEQERASAASVDTLRALSPVATETKKAIEKTGDPALDRAQQLLDANQPAQALDQMQIALPRHPRDPNVLVLAGLAAYRADQLRAAMDYWKQALDIAPDERLEAIYERVKREAAADRSGNKLFGVHVALRYEGEALPSDTARAILATLDGDYSTIATQLGCTSDERIVAIVQSREAYLRSTGAAEWSGGQYDGRIHIAAVPHMTDGEQVGPQMQRALAHELVHACLTSIPSGSRPWPAWLQEGLAQKLSGDTLSAAVREQLRQLAQTHTLPKLENLRQDWSRMNTQNALAAYSLALAAADALYDNYASYGIRNILSNPETLPRITADLDTKLGL